MSTLEWLQVLIGTGLFLLLVVMAWGVTRHSRQDRNL